jgi:hypothetical protein
MLPSIKTDGSLLTFIKHSQFEATNIYRSRFCCKTKKVKKGSGSLTAKVSGKIGNCFLAYLRKVIPSQAVFRAGWENANTCLL